jgi:hypothetical protein
MKMTRESAWMCKDGTIVKVKDMSDAHLSAALAMVEKLHWRREYLDAMRSEKKRRKRIAESPLGRALS